VDPALATIGTADSTSNMPFMRPESTAINVTDRIDALAAALRAAGVSPDQASRVLSSAATAAMHAVTLDALLDVAPAPAPKASAEAPPVRQPARIAA
jgi:hypothetical protein